MAGVTSGKEDAVRSCSVDRLEEAHGVLGQ